MDDDDDDQEIFLAAMKELSPSVVCTALSSAKTALHQLEQQETMADIIFLDLNMPIMNGQQFLTEVKKNEILKQIPVIILSTSSRIETIRETKALGARDFITKPSNFRELKNILESILT